MRRFSPDSPWRLDPAITFLNHGSFGACPLPVLAHQRALIDELEAEPVAFLDTTIEARLDDARHVVARFLNADPDGLVFVPNATNGVSTVLRSLRFEPGDELLTTNHEYNATLNALAEVARAAGATVVTVQLPAEITSGDEVVEAVRAAVTPNTRLAMVSHITSPTATILPIEQIVRMLDDRGVDTLVDAAHAPGQVPVDVEALGAAYWTGNGHKWLCGPKGTGMLHVRADRRDRIRPLVISHGWNDPRSGRPRLWLEFDWTGTPDPTSYLTLPAAISTIRGLHPNGWPGLMGQNHQLAIDGRRLIADALGVTPRTPESMHGSMATIPLPMTPSDEAARALKRALIDEDRIEVPISPFPVPAGRRDASAPPSAVVVRISAQQYNEIDDYARLADALVHRLG
ncbi:MAG: aminotransferase class V-fold PLP-dependent enzyme [Chloroflexota bacterium]|nr:MAG: aminotransferase class V-fold PLP-dependent enzyme [Chloroflexota bacterium]